ncbi:MAG: heparan-alpha-glucosaminide N-acetyltransferase domain-containing protein [Mucilaginibacter sp.]
MATTDADLTKPVTGYNERIDVIDVLRGFALLGIIVSHLTSSFSSAIPHMTGRVDMMLFKGVELFVMDKFYLIFSFLFGLSFYIQLQRATAKKTKFVGRFVWRSVILLMIGNIHTLFYTGDVLHVYALLGLLLLLGNKLSNKVLILLSCILIFGNPWLLKLQDITWKQPAEIAMEKAADAALIQKAGIVRLQGSFGAVIANNIDLAKRF